MYADLHSFGQMLRNGVAGPYGRSSVSVLRSLHTDFHRECTSLHSHQQCVRDSSIPHHHRHLLSCVSLTDILTGVRWNLRVVLTCVSFLAKVAEHVFMYLSCVLLLKLVICPFIDWIIYSFGVLIFCMKMKGLKFLVFNSLCILDIKPVRCISGKDFLPFCGLSLHPDNCFLCCTAF
jgi:hypothetical protein